MRSGVESSGKGHLSLHRQRARLARRAACNRCERNLRKGTLSSGLERRDRSEDRRAACNKRRRITGPQLQFSGGGAKRQKLMRNWSVFTVRIGGLEIRIHLTFIVLLLFLLLVEVNRSGPRVAARVVVMAGFILVSALLHEIAHTVVSRRQGFPIKGFVLLPIGGLAMGDPTVQAESARDLRKETLIALAGPLVNAVLAGAAALVLLAMGKAHNLWQPPLVTPSNLGTRFFWINASL